MKKTTLPFLQHLPVPLLVIACLTLGMAPFSPQPHLFEKVQLLRAGLLVRPIDIFDLVFHALPWLLLITKLTYEGLRRKTER